MDKSIYEPREDSYLILKHIPEFAKEAEDALDMGTGSGILAEAAAIYAKKVLAADINEAAVDSFDYIVKDEKIKNIEVVKSDLFENIDKNRKFDLIIFNPPYLPTDEELKDIAVDGGKEGYEVIERFLVKAKEYLKPKGKILLLFSSLSKKEVLDGILKIEGYRFREIDSLKLAFERLYVYIISV